MTWRAASGEASSGRLELGPHSLRLSGGPEPLEVPYSRLAGVSVARAKEERIDERRTLRLDLDTGERLSLTTVTGLGALLELAELLGRLAQTA